tara:strand:- start:25370 stop:25516 length:147 start_codon:yes stop_codon:yes gene_type:complete
MINGINTCLFYKGLRFKHNIERGKNESGKIFHIETKKGEKINVKWNKL